MQSHGRPQLVAKLPQSLKNAAGEAPGLGTKYFCFRGTSLFDKAGGMWDAKTNTCGEM
jgi:hypothetical protein